MINDGGVFTISLDYELYWGVRDKRTISEYQANLEGVSVAIDEILMLFSKFKIHATWSTVGLLMADGKDNVYEYLPNIKPSYKESNLSPYPYLYSDWDHRYDHLHFAKNKVDKICHVKGQRVGTHTFSHFYAQELGQSIIEFEADLESAQKIAGDILLNSIVFPRNQWNEEYLKVLSKFNIHSYRGNESSWLYKSSTKDDQGLFKRILRLIDSYLNISGHNTQSVTRIAQSYPYNISSSRLLRAYSKKLSFFNFLKLSRIKKSMTFAAINNEVFHLWWHPHNFGINLNENISFLEEVLQHYIVLKQKYGMESLNMEEISDLIMQAKKDE
jgi:peptidoglycan/xylan/chitin deacetylase (PgdA/CDA1 family)